MGTIIMGMITLGIRIRKISTEDTEVTQRSLCVTSVLIS